MSDREIIPRQECGRSRHPATEGAESKPFTWQCTSCGTKLRDAEVGSVITSRFHYNQLSMVECPLCHGAAQNIQQIVARRGEEVRVARRESGRRVVACVAILSGAGLFLLFPGMLELLFLYSVLCWRGPLAAVDIKSRMGGLIIMGAVFCINVFTGAFSMGAVNGHGIMPYLGGGAALLLAAAMAFFVERVGRFAGKLFYR